LDVDGDFEKLEKMIQISRLANVNFDTFKKIKEDITQRQKPTLPQTKKPPVFHYPQISWLYQHSFSDMPDEKIGELLSLEKEWLRIDLETVIYDAIRRYKLFEEKELDDSEDAFCLHALYLLKEIKAEESLTVILEFLRQPGELLDFWLSDSITENMWQIIYAVGFNQTDKLASFLKEPFNYTFARTEVSVALTQIVNHHPERRKEIVELYKDVMQFFISNKENKTIIDETMIGLMIGDIAEFNGKELLQEIELLFDEGLVDESVNGDMDEVVALMNEMHGDTDNAFKKELQNYFEIKAEIASWETSDNEEGNFINDKDEREYYDEWEEVVEEDTTEYFYSGSKPFVRTAPKVGRNEPCPCGSGKKYKNCCGRSE
jgi:hypothetical protein